MGTFLNPSSCGRVHSSADEAYGAVSLINHNYITTHTRMSNKHEVQFTLANAVDKALTSISAEASTLPIFLSAAY